MVDVVNSVATSAAILRLGSNAPGQNNALDQQNLIAEAVTSGAPTTPQAPYVSPYISVNYDYDKAVLQIRDAETGDVQEQFPTNSRLAEIRRAQVQLEQADRIENARLEQPQTGSSDQSQQQAIAQASTQVITVQDVTSAPPANAGGGFSPQIAVAALSAASSSSVSVDTQSSVSVQA